MRGQSVRTLSANGSLDALTKQPRAKLDARLQLRTIRRRQLAIGAGFGQDFAEDRPTRGHKGAFAMATTLTLRFTNSGPQITELRIWDDIDQQDRWGPGQFAANDAMLVDGFHVRDASRLVTDIIIYKDGAQAFPLMQDVPANSTVDVFNGNITPG